MYLRIHMLNVLCVTKSVLSRVIRLYYYKDVVFINNEIKELLRQPILYKL